LSLLAYPAQFPVRARMGSCCGSEEIVEIK
jgi:hypothetical protein